MAVSDRDRRYFRRLGEWKAALPSNSPPPPRTFDQVSEVLKVMQRGLSPLPLHGDDEAAIARLTDFRERLLRGGGSGTQGRRETAPRGAL